MMHALPLLALHHIVSRPYILGPNVRRVHHHHTNNSFYWSFLLSYQINCRQISNQAVGCWCLVGAVAVAVCYQAIPHHNLLLFDTPPALRHPHSHRPTNDSHSHTIARVFSLRHAAAMVSASLSSKNSPINSTCGPSSVWVSSSTRQKSGVFSSPGMVLIRVR